MKQKIFKGWVDPDELENPITACPSGKILTIIIKDNPEAVCNKKVRVIIESEA